MERAVAGMESRRGGGTGPAVSACPGALSESTKVYGGIRLTESPYEMADILRNSKKGLRIIYDPRKDWYIYNDESERIHVDMMEYAIMAGFYPEIPGYWEADGYMWSGEPDSPICLWFQPKGSERNEMVGIDRYTEELVYPFGHLAGRCEYLDFPLTEGKIPLVGKLGKPIAHYILDDYKVKRIEESLLVEKTRQQLLNKSRNADSYAPSNRAKGKNRYERRRYSKVANTIKDYNSIDMNAFFKGDYLEFGVNVKGETNDYKVTVTFEGILNGIRDEVKANKYKLEFKCVIKALLHAFNNNDVYISCTCLHPDTKINLLDGTSPTVEEMKRRFDSGERLYVYSVDEHGDFKPGEVEGVYVTGESSDFIEITLDNGESILTTGDHPYMLRDGTYKAASELKVGQSLMPLYFNESNGYATIISKIEHVHTSKTPVYDIKVKHWHNFAVDAGVILHNCPDFVYSGNNYYAVKQDYNSNPIFGKAMQAPNIKNPHDTKGAGCKHILLVLSNTEWMMKVASVIYNYIKFSKANLQRNYAQIIFPKVYGMPYQGAVNKAIGDRDDRWGDALLVSDKQELDNVIAGAVQGRDLRGRFSKGNPFAFRKKGDQSPKGWQNPDLRLSKANGGKEDADDKR